ncbi:MAG TPA: hypothetical protein PKE56_11280 [Acidimicrobiales bacterium]|nr:hypothetical protein [Acidimicrobiales bacterium]
MPVGLDGNPDPIVTPQRTAVLEHVAGVVGSCPTDRVLVGVDGRSGAGKSTFADELAAVLVGQGIDVVRSTTDLFHRPRGERLARGPASPQGYYEDSHQLGSIVDGLLRPFRSGVDDVLVGAFDEPSDQPRELRATVPARSVLVFDGLFVQRPGLADWWHVSVFLNADRRCDERWLAYLEGGLPTEATGRAAEIDRRLAGARWPRYRVGWSQYADDVQPEQRATVVIDNDDLGRPTASAGTVSR